MTTTAEPVFEAWPEGTPQGEHAAIAGRTPFQLFWERFREDRVALAALGFIVLEIADRGLRAVDRAGARASAERAVPRDASTPASGRRPGRRASFLFGVDTVGRDVFARVVYGARVSLEVALVATALSVGLGVVAGMLAGFHRGAVDTLISRRHRRHARVPDPAARARDRLVVLARERLRPEG